MPLAGELIVNRYLQLGADLMQEMPPGVASSKLRHDDVGVIVVKVDSRLKHAGMTDFGLAIDLTQQTAGE